MCVRDRQTDRQTERQTDGETDRQTEMFISQGSGKDWESVSTLQLALEGSSSKNLLARERQRGGERFKTVSEI